MRSTPFFWGVEVAACGVWRVNETSESGLTWTTHCEIGLHSARAELAFRNDENCLIWSFTLGAVRC